MSLGARITELRLAANQTLQELADSVGISKAHIWELEKGRTDNPSLALVTRLAHHFQVPLSQLAGEPTAEADPAIGRLFRHASNLHPEDVALLEDMMQSLLKRRRKSSARTSASIDRDPDVDEA